APARVGLELLAPRAAEDRAAVLDDAADVAGAERADAVLHEALEAAVDAEDLPSAVDRAAHDGPDGRIHSGGVSPTRENGDLVHSRPTYQQRTGGATPLTASGGGARPRP